MSADTINAAINDAVAVRNPLDELVAKAAADPGAAFEPDALTLLTTLKQENPAAFQRVRARLKNAGTIIGELDKLLAAKTGEAKEISGQGQPLSLPEPESWHEPVDGAELLDALVKAIRGYVVMAENAVIVVALWILHTYVFDTFTVTPRLTISSPEKGCGKTTLLDVLYQLVLRPLLTANASVAVVFRVIEAALPTLLIDEADASLKDNEELRGILNSGHRKGGSAIRTVGDDHEPRTFSTWCPLAIALIGKLPDTLQDRSILIALRRRRADEPIIAFRADRTSDLQTLARMAARWAADHRDTLAKADPLMPDCLFNRAADNWRPLLAIADAAGGKWPERTRKAALEMSTGGDVATASYRTQLLADIKAIFDARDADKISSKELVETLVNIEGRPWAEYGRQHKAITQNTLAHLLAPFSITSGTVRISDEHTPKGYKREQFADAWERYLSPIPPESTATPPQGAENLYSPAVYEAPQDDDGGGLENAENARETAYCGGVADQYIPSWETEE